MSCWNNKLLLIINVEILLLLTWLSQFDVENLFDLWVVGRDVEDDLWSVLQTKKQISLTVL